MADGDAPNIQGLPAGVTSDPGALAQVQPQQAQQQPPQMGGQPLLLQYIRGMMQGPQGTVQPGQAQPQRPVSRSDMTLDFLGHFLSNLSQGLAASGHGPGAGLRGFAGAVQAPYQRAVAQYQMGQQQQQLESEQALRGAQAESLRPTVPMVGPNGESVMIPPAHIAQALMGGFRYRAAQYTADTRAATGTEIAGLKYGPAIEITGDLAKAYGLSSDLVGEKLTPGAIQRLAPNAKVISTSEGMFFADPRTGQKIGQRLGSTPSVTNAQTAAQAKITVEGMRDVTQQAKVFNLADKPAQIMYSKTMDQIKSWADNEQKSGYLGFGADPAQAQKAFEAERQRRIDAANADLLKRTESKIGANAPPSGFPQPVTSAPSRVPSKSATPKANPFTAMIKANPRLSQATNILDKLSAGDRKSAIDQKVATGQMPKADQAILYSYYGLK